MDRRRLQLGLFVVASAALLGMLAVFFGGTPRMFTHRNHYTIVFDEATGVVKGTPVRKSGVRIGEVEAVVLDDEKGVVRVQIAIDPAVSLRTDEEPVIVTDLLSRDSTIDFVPISQRKKPAAPADKPNTKAPVVPVGYRLLAQAEQPKGAPPPGPPRVIPPGSEIRGRTPVDTRQLIRDASEVLPSAQASLNAIRKSVERFEQLAPVMEETMREFTELARAARATIPELRQTNDKVAAAVDKASKLEPDIRRSLEEVQATARQYGRLGEKVEVTYDANRNDIDRAIKNIAETAQRIAAVLSEENQRNFTASLRNVQSMTKNIDETANRIRTQTLPPLESAAVSLDKAIRPFGDRSERMAQNLDFALERTARAIGSFADMFSTTGRADGSLQRLLNDPSVFNNLNDASLMLVRILPRVDRALRDLEVFADKIARHPETLGVGGAVRPSAGLKEGAPVNPYSHSHSNR